MALMIGESETTVSPFTFGYFYSKDRLKIRYGQANSKHKPAKGIILLLHGRSEFLEKYTNIVNRLNEKQYNVFSLDWRGQGLSDRETVNRQKGYVKDFSDYTSDLEVFFNRFLSDQGLPKYILAHSMGGHIGLRFMHRHSSAIQKAILASPMIDIALPPVLRMMSQYFAKRACEAGLGKKYILGGKDYSASIARFKRNRLSHDPENFWILHNEIKKNPDLAIGDATWGWLHAAFESISILNSREYISSIYQPALILGAKKDSIVSFNAQKKFCQNLPCGTFVPVSGAYHEIMFEELKINQIFWRHFDEFIDNSNE